MRTYFRGTCQHCEKQEGNPAKLFPFNDRHWHHACFLKGHSLNDLQPWQIRQFPFALLQELDLLDEARELCRREGR